MFKEEQSCHKGTCILDMNVKNMFVVVCMWNLKTVLRVHISAILIFSNPYFNFSEHLKYFVQREANQMYCLLLDGRHGLT